MPEHKHKSESKEQEAAAAEEAEAQQQVEDSDAAAGEADEEPVEVALGDDAVHLEAEVATLKDQLLRALAETENLRRRHQRERGDLIKYAAAPVIKDIVGVADNLRRAMDNIPAEAVENDDHLKTLLTGLELTEKELATVFERHSIVRIDPVGEQLNPHYHEAMFEVPDPSVPSGTVVQVVQAGYRLHDRLLRPAQVGVAKGGPAPAKTSEPKGAEPEGAEAEAKAAEAPKPNGGEESANGPDDTAPGRTLDTSV